MYIAQKINKQVANFLVCLCNRSITIGVHDHSSCFSPYDGDGASFSGGDIGFVDSELGIVIP